VIRQCALVQMPSSHPLLKAYGKCKKCIAPADVALQRALFAEIEAMQTLGNANQKLIERMKKNPSHPRPHLV
jgi:hypothetical protein